MRMWFDPWPCSVGSGSLRCCGYGSCSSNSTPSLGIFICLGWGPKKTDQKKKKKKKKQGTIGCLLRSEKNCRCRLGLQAHIMVMDLDQNFSKPVQFEKVQGPLFPQFHFFKDVHYKQPMACDGQTHWTNTWAQ